MEQDVITNQFLADTMHVGIARLGIHFQEAGDEQMELHCHAMADVFDELCERFGLEGLFEATPRIIERLEE